MINVTDGRSLSLSFCWTEPRTMQLHTYCLCPLLVAMATRMSKRTVELVELSQGPTTATTPPWWFSLYSVTWYVFHRFVAFTYV
jgi:hypothetical protein